MDSIMISHAATRYAASVSYAASASFQHSGARELRPFSPAVSGWPMGAARDAALAGAAFGHDVTFTQDPSARAAADVADVAPNGKPPQPRDP